MCANIPRNYGPSRELPAKATPRWELSDSLGSLLMRRGFRDINPRGTAILRFGRSCNCDDDFIGVRMPFMGLLIAVLPFNGRMSNHTSAIRPSASKALLR